MVDTRPHFVSGQGDWVPPSPASGGWFRQHLARPPHGGRFAGEIRDSGVTNDHRYLREFIAGFADNARLLDLGSGERRLTPGTINLDIVASPSVDVVADGHELPFPDEVFEAVIMQSVMEHVLEPEKLLSESRRVLKPGGQIWVEVPFHYPVHARADYYRWTLSGLRYVVSKYFDVTQGAAIMGPSSAFNLAWRGFVDWKLRRVHWGIRNGLAWMTAWVKFLDPDEAMTEPPDIYAAGYVVGRKP